MSISLRRTKWDDRLPELDRLIFPGDEPIGINDARAWWIATDGSRPVGYCCASDIGSGLTYIVRAGVLPSHRRLGIYRRMVRAICVWGDSRRAGTVITYTLANNDASSNCLIRSGFLLYQPEWAWAGRDGVLYWMRSNG